MQRRMGFFVLLVIPSLCLGTVAFAQTSSSPANASDVSQQFTSGANRVGNGVVQMGQGVKQGAIMTWEAVRDGAEAVAARFSGNAPAQKSQ